MNLRDFSRGDEGKGSREEKEKEKEERKDKLRVLSVKSYANGI